MHGRAVQFGFAGCPGEQAEEKQPVTIPMGTWVRAGWSGWVNPIFSSRAKIDALMACLVVYDWCSLGRIDAVEKQ